MEEKLKIFHTANAGALINIGRESLGVDLFSRDPEKLYPDTPEWVRQELLKRIERKEISRLLFTHGHGDHFCMEDVLEALRRNPELVIISTEEVIEQIREREKSAGVLMKVPVGETGNYRVDFQPFSLELFYYKHMGAQYEGVQNLACMLQVEGQRLLIPGDAWPEPEFFARVRKWSPKIEILLAPFPLVGIPTTRRIMEKELSIEQILAIHLPRPEADTQNWLASAKNVCARAKDSLPLPVFGEVPGTGYCFDKSTKSLRKTP